MVDSLLFILLAMVAVLLLAQYFLYRHACRVHKRRHTAHTQREIVALQSLYEYFYQHPASEMTGDFPHLASMAEATKEYQELNRLYEQGIIDDIDYYLQLEKLLPKVNIEEDF